MSKQVMQRALDALEQFATLPGVGHIGWGGIAAIAELRAEIAKPAEPVGYTDADGLNYVDAHFVKIAKCFPPGEWIAVYTTPPDTEGLRRDAELWRAYKARKDAVIAAGMGKKAMRDAAIAAQGGGV